MEKYIAQLEELINEMEADKHRALSANVVPDEIARQITTLAHRQVELKKLIMDWEHKAIHPYFLSGKKKANKPPTDPVHEEIKEATKDTSTLTDKVKGLHRAIIEDEMNEDKIVKP